MDDDDGLLLNISTAPITSHRIQPVLTGGRWRDRWKAKQKARGIEPVSKSSANSEQIDESKTKFKKYDKDTATSDKSVRVPKSEAGKHRKKLKSSADVVKERKKPQPKIKPNFDADGNTFVSSIFSAEDENVKNEKSDALTPGEASNAPLQDKSTFVKMQLDSRLCNALETNLKLTVPTAIQKAVIPRLVVNDRDLFVQAQTGSGKTLAFVVPILQRLKAVKTRLSRESGLFAIILTPTRELSNQTYSILEILCRASCPWIVPGIVIGGENKKAEKARIRKGVNILVATPGRLADHFSNTRALFLSEVRWVVLDEGDRLMELGFEETITDILSRIKAAASYSQISGLPEKQVNVICSATMKSGVKKLGELSLENAEWVTPSADDETITENGHSAPDQLVQKTIILPAKLRLVTLGSILMNLAAKTEIEKHRIIVFLSCSDSVEFHYALFGRKNDEEDSDDEKEDEKAKVEEAAFAQSPLLSSTTIFKLHGSLNQKQRTTTLEKFKNASGTSILFCTDVASRGLDLPGITDVVEYDPPFNVDDHLHRVGRTARAGESGTSFLFLLPTEQDYLDIIAPLHHSGVQKISYDELLADAFGEAWESDATTWHLNSERWLLKNSQAASLAKQAFKSHIRAYATHITAEKSIFNVRMLHLGHIAKSFALRDPPGQTSSSSTKKRRFASADTSSNKKIMLNMARKMNAMSEFNIG